MLERLTRIARVVSDRWRLVIVLSLSFTLAYYVLQLGAMIVKFNQWPNYTQVYDWPANVLLIIDSTPSMRDTLLIIKEEWVFEVGYMNYEYGIGISQWSLYLSPVKVLSIVVLGAMLVLLALLGRDSARGATGKSCVIAGGAGATAASVSLMSLSWVVCCATPSWVVGLSILGMGASTALWLAPIGIWLNVTGFAVLALMLWLLAVNPKTDRQTA